MKPRNRSDYWTLRAKALGYPARSVFKLEEMQKKWNLIRPNQAVLDLGAAPGSWTLYVLRNFPRSTGVTAVDLKPLTVETPKNRELQFLQGDFFAEEAALFLKNNGPYGCVLSDAAPATSGNRVVDSRKSFNMVMRVIALAEDNLLPGGNLVVKVFPGGDENEIRNRMRPLFSEYKAFKPRAVRAGSMEIYMMGRGFTARPHPPG